MEQNQPEICSRKMAKHEVAAGGIKRCPARKTHFRLYTTAGGTPITSWKTTALTVTDWCRQSGNAVLLVMDAIYVPLQLLVADGQTTGAHAHGDATNHEPQTENVISRCHVNCSVSRLRMNLVLRTLIAMLQRVTSGRNRFSAFHPDA